MRWTRAQAKVNLTLRVIGRRLDGYHELESFVAFAGLCDWLGFEPGADIALDVVGPRAQEAGRVDENLVLRATRELAARVPGLTVGRFRLIKNIPAAAGLGGGSADAAAALRLLADVAGLAIDDPRLCECARRAGADVPSCLSSKARIMTGVGDQLGPAIPLPKMFAVLVNPRVETPTPKIFAALGLAPEARFNSPEESTLSPGPGFSALLDALAANGNDLQAAAISVVPAIGAVIKTLSEVPGTRLVRMSGSGATCYALFDDRRTAATARRLIEAKQPDWWVETTTIQ